MNAVKTGYNFEKKAKEYLKKIFDVVIWESEKNRKADVDFTCKMDNTIYKIDAKYSYNGNPPEITFGQRNVDFIIFGTKDNVELIPKNKFKEKGIRVVKHGKIITISNKTKKKLNKIKKDKAYKSYNQLITFEFVKNKNLQKIINQEASE